MERKATNSLGNVHFRPSRVVASVTGLVGAIDVLIGRTNSMNSITRYFAPAAIIALAVSAATAARADDGDSGSNRFVVTNLTSNLKGVAPNMDPVLQNAWGVAFSPGAVLFGLPITLPGVLRSTTVRGRSRQLCK